MRNFLILIFMLFVYFGFTNAQASEKIVLTDKNTISFNEAFTAMYVAQKQLEAIKLCDKKNKDIYLVLYTPGGSISAGKRLYDTLHSLDCNFHTITIAAFSMGYQTVQNLGTRYILPSGILMSHRASVRGLGGEVFGELDTILNLIKREVTELDIIAAKRVGLSVDKYRKDISDELWLTGKEAVKLNHADKLALPVCDKSLLGTHIRNIRTFFGVYSVEFSNCPLITSPLRVVSVRKGKKSDLLNFYNNIRNYVGYEL